MGKPKIVKDTAERWLLTYADLMNLLLIFFIILYALSQVDQQKFEQLATALREAFGEGVSTSHISPETSGANNSIINLDANAPSSVIPSKIEQQQMEQAKKEIEEKVRESNISDKVKVTIEERGIKISITAHYLFKSGSAQMEANATPTVQEIGKILSTFTGNLIRVEGHTDNVPIHTPQFPTNWELSSARAANVLRLLVDKVGISPKTISAVGYGEYQNDYPNDNEDNRKKNRRVDIIILKKSSSIGEAYTDTPKTTQPGADLENTKTSENNKE